jgi:hypothetical protein
VMSECEEEVGGVEFDAVDEEREGERGQGGHGVGVSGAV